jgi:hypothetical protein
MSIPHNHHYVSQVLIKKFLNTDKRVSIFSKTKNNIETKTLQRKDFAERDLNSIISDENTVDHKSIEDNLNENFERDFNKHYDSLFLSIENNNLDLFIESIKFLIKLGIIGDMRTREHQLEDQQAILGGIGSLYEMFSDDLKAEYSSFINRNSTVKNKLPVNYSELTNGILEIIGDACYCVFKASKNHHFLLPDNTSIIHRSKIDPDIETEDGKTFVSLAMPITMIIYPINNKTIIVVKSKKMEGEDLSGVFQLSEKTTIDYNILLIKNSRDKVICGDENYLKDFIDKHASKL